MSEQPPQTEQQAAPEVAPVKETAPAAAEAAPVADSAPEPAAASAPKADPPQETAAEDPQPADDAEPENQENQPPVPENSGPPPAATGGPYSYDMLKAGCVWPPDVDPTKRESYLTEEEFAQIFQMTKEEFYKKPAWKQAQLKQPKELF